MEVISAEELSITRVRAALAKVMAGRELSPELEDEIKTIKKLSTLCSDDTSFRVSTCVAFEFVLSGVSSCHADGDLCGHQLTAFLTLGIAMGLYLAEDVAQVRSLERMAR